jgi:hypothetical protein
MSSMTDKQVDLLVLFKTAHRKKVMRQFMEAEREAVVVMLAVRVITVREATCTVAEEEVVWEAAIAIVEAAAREEVAQDRVRWDEDIAAVSHTCEFQELATEHCHRGRQAHR